MSPEYVTLAHEMAHAKSYRLGIQNIDVGVDGAKQMLTDNVTIDELYTTHIENKVRAAAGLKLRPSYVPSERTFSDVLEGSKSLHINKNEDYSKMPLQKVSRNDAFDYRTIKKDGSN
ncbi:hypothetical protein [Apibacter sp. HY039]|uniref:hypothetical protein n=1 Tax=Apibacter sp. HY039 TaxID=2501476 RepID=UPI000FEBE206|nr:hypothetical protein [Apibacter sp. HY039]